MNLINFYTEILSLSLPWKIASIEIDKIKNRIILHLGHSEGSLFPCKKCGQLSSVYDHQKSRTWRHLNSCQYETYLVGKLPRTNCLNCGSVKTISVPWSSNQSRFTEDFECYAIDTLQINQVIHGTATLLNITDAQVSYLMKKSVARGLERRKNCVQLVNYLAIDEKSYKEGHHYVTILSDADNDKVIEVVEDRTIASVEKAYKSLNNSQLAHIKGVSMDMWSAFASVSQAVAPQSDIVHDRFHLSCYLNNALDITRRAENKKLLNQDNELLKGTKYIWLKDTKKLSVSAQDNLDKIIQQKDLKTVQAYELKERFKSFFDMSTIEQATTFFDNWFDDVVSSQNLHLIKVANMFKSHWLGIKNYIQHRITNAVAESLNSRIQQLKVKAKGFNSADAFRTAILFHFGKLHMYP